MICLTLSEGQFVYFKDDELVDYLMCFSDMLRRRNSTFNVFSFGIVLQESIMIFQFFRLLQEP